MARLGNHRCYRFQLAGAHGIETVRVWALRAWAARIDVADRAARHGARIIGRR